MKDNRDSDSIPGATRPNELLQGLPDAFFEIDGKGLVKNHLSGAKDDRLIRPAKLVGKRFSDVWPGLASDMIGQHIRRALKSRNDQSFNLELSNKTGSGRYEVRLLVKGRDCLLAVFRRMDKEGPETRNHSFSDTLTGLPNRQHFLLSLESLLADARLRDRGLALMCIDIDGFGSVNETLGRPVGNIVLKTVAKRIQGCFREADPSVRPNQESDELARVGGDEFALVLTGIESQDDVVAIVDRVQQVFAEPVAYENNNLQITPSIGIARFPVDGSDAETLFANARAALDEAKTHGDNGRAFYSGTMQLRALQRFDQKDELRWAMEQNQLTLHYLPRIDLASGRIIGLEALLRWINPIRGNVPLSEIIPLAEATGLMLPLGEWIIDTACAHARAWGEHCDEPPIVSINLSRQEFSRDDLAELIARSLARHELPGQRLQLDLKEILLMRHDRASRVLESLKALGIRLVIDDFGTGLSSLERLNSLPIDALKIDRSFVDGIEKDSGKRAICGAIILMARELGIRVIGEGVETEGQLGFLRAKGCNAAQGFFYTKPLAADNVIGFLEAWARTAGNTSIVALETVRERVAP